MRRTAMTGVGTVLLMISTVLAQAPRERPGDGRPGQRGPDAQPREDTASRIQSAVARMMAFDANGDGKVSKDEMPDERLSRLLERADTDRDGAVSREEFTLQFTKDAAALGPGPGPGRFGPGGQGPGGFRQGGQGPSGPPPRPGQVLPPPILELLDLNEEQLQQYELLQKEVDERLAKILTEEQRRLLHELPNRGPRGFGGPGGPGFGRQGGFGPPPGGEPGAPRLRRPAGRP